MITCTATSLRKVFSSFSSCRATRSLSHASSALVVSSPSSFSRSQVSLRPGSMVISVRGIWQSNARGSVVKSWVSASIEDARLAGETGR